MPQQQNYNLQKPPLLMGHPPGFHPIPQYPPPLINAPPGGVNAAYFITQQQQFHPQQFLLHQMPPQHPPAFSTLLVFPNPPTIYSLAPSVNTIQQQNFVVPPPGYSQSTPPSIYRPIVVQAVPNSTGITTQSVPKWEEAENSKNAASITETTDNSSKQETVEKREGRDHWVEISGRGFGQLVIDNRAHYEVHFRLLFGADSIREIRVPEKWPNQIQLNFVTETLANEAITKLNHQDSQIYPVIIRATRWFPLGLDLEEFVMEMTNKLPPQKGTSIDGAMPRGLSLEEMMDKFSLPPQKGTNIDSAMTRGKISFYNKARKQCYSLQREKAEQKKSPVNPESSVPECSKKTNEIRTSTASYKIRSDMICELEAKVRGMTLGSTEDEDSESEDPFYQKACHLLLAGDNLLPEALEPKKQCVGGLGGGSEVTEQSLSSPHFSKTSHSPVRSEKNSQAFGDGSHVIKAVQAKPKPIPLRDITVHFD